MSVPNKNTTWGEVLYKGKIYGVLGGFHLSEEIWEKYSQYDGDKGYMKSTAPWATIKINWSIKGDKLYLTRYCSEGLLTELFGEEKILADWVDEMELLVKHRRICKTYESKNSYLNKMEILHLSLDRGIIVDQYNKTELYTSIEMKNYIDRSPAYASFQIDSMDLLDYLENVDTKPIEDEILPIMSSFICQMIQKGSEDDINLSIEDVKSVLNNTNSAVFSSAKGNKLDEMVESLAYSMTDEVLQAKGCLFQFIVNKDYPINDLERFINSFEIRLNMNKEEKSDAYISDMGSFVFGVRLSDEIDQNEVLVRVLLSI